MLATSMGLLIVASLVAPFDVVAQVNGAVQAGQVASAPMPQPSFGDMLVRFLPMFLMVYLIFHFMVLKPQNQKLKAQQELLASLKRGDGVVTTGGIIGKVAGIESDHVVMEIAPNVKVKVERAHVQRREKEEVKSAA
jgi:preprotein translocase subunit YajC